MEPPANPGRFTGANEDRLFNIEKIQASSQDDKVIVTYASAGSITTIDGGGQTSARGDQLDLSALDQSLTFGNGGRVYNSSGDQILVQKDFETVYATAYGDNYNDRSTANATVFLGGGADVVQGAGSGSTIYLGANDHAVDIVSASGNVKLEDVGTEDQIYVGNQLLRGGTRNTASDSAWATSFGGAVQYGITTTGDLMIKVAGLAAAGASSLAGSVMTIAGWNSTYNKLNMPFLGVGGLMLAQVSISATLVVKAPPGMNVITGQLELLAVKMYQALGVNKFGLDPLVLDLNGDGFNIGTLSRDAPQFDTDADLYSEHTAWVGREDGFLARDINHNGEIDDSRELFGGTQDGLAVLAALDGNHDGVVNALDNGLADFNGDGAVDASDTFAELKIWRDLNQDGKTNDGELQALSAYDIVGLNTTGTPSNENISGSLITATSTFIRGDGTTGAVGDAVLRLDNQHTKYIGPDITITTAAEAEPELSGAGTLVSLRQAMSLDSAALTVVDQVVANFDAAQHDIASLRDAVRPLLTAWANASPLRDASGAIVSGSDVMHDYDNLSVVRTDGKVSDYSYATTDETLVINGENVEVRTYHYVSGLTLSVTGGANPSKVQSDWGSPVSTTTVTETVNGQDHTTTRYTYANGESVYGAVPTGDEYQPQRDTFSTLLQGDHDSSLHEHHYSIETTPNEDVAFYARYIGETLPFGTTPVDGAAALEMMDTFYSLLNQTLDMLSVRVAVQAPAFASIFPDIAYDDVNNNFHATGTAQLTPVYSALLSQADGQADPIAWLASWKPMLDLVVTDFNRGNGLLNTNGFVAENIIAAFEQVHPSIALLDAVDVLGVDRDMFVLGSGAMAGTDGADIFYLDSSDQTASGGLGLDNYIVGHDFGHDVIDDEEAPLSPHDDDVVRFTDLNPEDVVVTRDGTDLIISARDGADVLRIVGQFAGEWAGPLGDGYWADKGVATIVFANGTTWDEIDMARAASHPDDASTTVVGTADNDFMDGGAGDDVLQGMGDGDIYVFGRGYGHDTIIDSEDNPFRPGFDILTFRTGIAMDDLVFHRDGNSNDLLITIGTDQVLIKDQFTATYTGVFGTQFLNQIEMFTFEDGGMMGVDDIDDAIIQQLETSGNDTIYGFSREDTLIGGAGDDFLSGGNENDTYVFGRGDGHDTITEGMTNLLGGATDTLSFKSGVAVSNVVFTRDGDDLIATIADTGDSVRIAGQYVFTETGPFGVQNFNRVETFAWADGTTMDWRSIMDGIIAAAGTSGNDTIVGTHFDDTIVGHAGDDLLQGGDGADRYLFNLGDGQDTIDDTWDNILSGDGDTIAFGAGVAAGDIHLQRTGDNGKDALLTVGSGGDSILLKGQFFTSTINYHPNEIEHITFADGTVWGPQDLRDLYIRDHETSGADTVDGFYTDDVLNGGTGNDLLRGGDGSDAYRFAVGDGNDTIDDGQGNILANNEDAIVFASGVNAGDLHVERAGDNLQDAVLTFANSSDSVTIKGQFLYTTINYRPNEIEHITFADGTSLTPDDLRHLYIQQHETSGNDLVQGFYTDDTINGGAGNDTLRGGDGSDTYVFDAGFGHDRIEESVGYVTYDDDDKVVFGAGLLSTDASFTISGTDLIINFAGRTDTLTVAGEFGHMAFYDGWQDVETFTFGDGVSIARNDIAQGWLDHQKTAGNDTITGFYLDDALDGGAGNDVLNGGEGDDTYLFGRGYGSDRVLDGGSAYDDGHDRVLFGAGVTSADITFVKSGNDLLVTINDTGDMLRIQNQYLWMSRIETFAFADGSSMTADAVELLAVSNQGTPGDDTITGTTHSDFLDGGTGNDLIQGRDGSDTYYFRPGDGQDTIQEGVDTSFIDDDHLVFADGIAPADVSIARSGNDLVMTFAGSADQIRVQGQFAFQGNGWNYSDIEHFDFADGTSWTDNDIRLRLIAQSETSGNDSIYGYATADTFDGGAGDDTIYGYDGGDTYLFGRGSGKDTIYEGGSAYNDNPDTLQFKSGVAPIDATFARHNYDLVVGIAGTTDEMWITDFFRISYDQVERFAFADGTVYDVATVTALANRASATSANDSLAGTPVADVMQGLGGDDTLTGLAGSDVYVYNIGDGNDTIFEGAFTADIDAISYGAGITPANVLISRSGLSGAVLTVTGQTGAITLDSQFKPGGYGIEQIRFNDGTVWSLADIQAAYLSKAQTSGNDTVYGFDAVNDTLQGGAGTDSLYGGTGSDTYRYNGGDGTDTITEAANAGDTDRLVLGTGLNASGLTFARSGATGLVLNFTAQSASITLANEFDTTAGSGVEQLQFGDGTVWTAAQLIYAYAVSRGTSGNDTINGSAGINDYLAGGAGNDSLYGYSGSDTYYYNLGDGADKIYEGYGSGDTDTLVFGAGITAAGTLLARTGSAGVTFSFGGQAGSVYLDNQFNPGSPGNGLEVVRFNDGTIWDAAAMRSAYLAQAQTSGNDTVYGFDGVNDTLQGGAGNDTLYGYSGSDTYVYNLGDGADKIYEGYGSGETDKLVLGDGITTSNLVISRGGSAGATLTVTGQSGSIYLDNQFNPGSPGNGIEQFQFSDGTVWDAAAMRSAYLSRVQTSGNDTIHGFDGVNDTLQGGTGNDVLYGYSGSDTYLYNLGDGADTISEGYGWGETDKLVLGAGITTSNIQLGRTGASGLTLTFAGQSGSIYLDYEFSNDKNSYGVDQIQFGNGTTWDLSAIRSAYLAQVQTSGNDSVYGFDSVNDTLQGGAGNDTLYGFAGSDTYIYNLGDGADTISDGYGWGETDKLVLGAGITTSNLLLGRTGSSGLTLTVAGQSGSIYLDYEFSNDKNGYGVEQIQFNSGTTWDLTAIRSAYLTQAQTSGNDSVYGFDSVNDTLQGGAGDDTLYGMAGSDTYVYNLGDGADRIEEAYGWGETDKLVLGAGITTSNIQLTRTGSTGLTVGFSGQSGSIYLDYQFQNDNNGYGVEQIQFNDGTVWNVASMYGNAWFRGTAGNDTIVATGSADKIDGGAGDDVLTGGAGADLFSFKSGFGHDQITDFSSSQTDVIEFSTALFSSYSDMLAHAAAVGNDVVITYDSANAVTLKNVALSNLHASDFHFV